MNHRVLGVLSLGHLTVDVSAGALPALLPFLQREFHLSYFWLAALVMTSGLTSSIVQPVFGVASDNLRTRFLLPLGVACALGGFAGIGVVGTYVAVLALVAVAGFGSAMYHPEASKSARDVSGRFPTTGMSYFGVGGNVGVALGPIIVTALIAWGGLRATMYLLIPAIAMALVVATVIPVVTRVARVEARSQAQARNGGAPGVLGVLMAVTTLRSLVYGGLLTFVPLYAVNILHQRVTQNGILLFRFLGAGAAANLIAGPIADRYGAKQTLSLSLALAPFALALYLLSSGVLAWAGLALTGAFIIGTFSTTVVMGQECLPNRPALASALLIGLATGLGGLGVGVLGKIADVVGLTQSIWMLVGMAALAYVVTLALPKSEPAAIRANAISP